MICFVYVLCIIFEDHRGGIHFQLCHTILRSHKDVKIRKSTKLCSSYFSPAIIIFIFSRFDLQMYFKILDFATA